MIAFFQMFEAIDFIVSLLLLFFIYSRLLYPDVVSNKLVAFVVTIIIWAIVIQYPLLKWLTFLGLFCYSFLWGFKPWEWGLADADKNEPPEKGMPYDAKRAEL